MSDEYQLRKDIDNIKDFSEEINQIKDQLKQQTTAYEMSEIIQSDLQTVSNDLDVVSHDFDIVSNDFDLVKASLIEFNGELIEFNGDNEILKTNLSTLKTNLSTFLVNIGALGDSVDHLEVSTSQLDSASTTLRTNLSGLTTSLNQLIARVNSLDSQLNALSLVVDDLDAGGDALSGSATELSNRIGTLEYTLNALSDYLLTFEGDLNDLQEELEDSDIDTSKLNADMVKLFGAIGEVRQNITSTQEQIDDTQGQVDNVKGIIGTDNDTTNATLKGAIKNTKSDINGVKQTVGTSTDSANANTVFGNIKKTTNSITTVNNIIGDENTQGTVKYDIKQTKANITRVDSDVGDLNDLIGTENSSDQSTVFGSINKSQQDVGVLQNTMYGKNSGGTIGNPDDNSLMGRMDTTEEDMTKTQGDMDQAKKDIKKAKQDIGTVPASKGSLQEQVDNLQAILDSDPVYIWTVSGAGSNRKFNVGDTINFDLEIIVNGQSYDGGVESEANIMFEFYWNGDDTPTELSPSRVKSGSRTLYRRSVYIDESGFYMMQYKTSSYTVFVDDDYVKTNDTRLFVPQLINSLESAKDLNNYLTPGIYYQSQSNSVNGVNGTISHCPLNTAFFLLVERSSGAVKQTWTTYAKGNPRTFIRTWNNWVDPQWGEWFELEFVKPYTQVQSPLTKNGATVKVYSDGRDVFLKFSGAVTLTANTNLTIGTLSSTTYAPYGYEYGHLLHGNLNIIGAVQNNGTVYIVNKSSATSATLQGSIRYPLRARTP